MKSKQFHRLISLLLTVAMLAGVLPMMAVQAAAAGGSADNPTIVTTYDALKSALESSASYVKLGADIETADLNGGDGYYNTIKITGTATLDLNGHVVRFYAAKSIAPPITVRGSLTIKASGGRGGLLLRASTNREDVTNVLISVSGGGTFTLNSGDLSVSDNTARTTKKTNVVQTSADKNVVTINGGIIAMGGKNITIKDSAAVMIQGNTRATFNGGSFSGWVGVQCSPSADALEKPRVFVNGGKFYGGFLVRSAEVAEGKFFPIRITGGVFGRGLFSDGFELNGSEQTPGHLAYASMFPENTALIRDNDLTRLIYRQRDVKSGSSLQYRSKEYRIELSVKPISNYDRPFTLYGNKGDYTTLHTDAFGLREVLLDGEAIAPKHIMDGASWVNVSSTPLYQLSNIGYHNLYFRWNDLPKQMKDAGYTQQVSYTLNNGTHIAVSPASTTDGVCEWIYQIPASHTSIQRLAFTVNLCKDGEPLIWSGAANQFLLRYQVLKDASLPISSVSLQVKGGDLVDSDDGTVSPVSVSAQENCTLVQQGNWADNGTKRNKTVTLKAKTGYYFTDKIAFTVEGAHRITAKYLYSSDGGTTCTVGLEAQECKMIYTAQGIVRNLVYRNRADDVTMDSFDPEKYTITVKEVGEYVSSTGSSISDAAMWPHELLGTDQPYYLYCTVEAKPGYVFRSGTSLLKYAMPSWNQNRWVTAVWDTDWRDCYDVYIGACYKTWDKTDTNLGGLWVDRILLDQLYLTVKAPRAGEKPAPGSAYCQVEGLPEYIKLERVDWLKCYDDWRYYSDRPFSFEAGVSPHYEDFEYQCFIHVSFDAGGVAPAKNAKFYLNDTPCRLSWDTADKFFYSDPMLAFDSAGSPVIAVKAGANGTVTPSGGVSVKAGESKTFTFQPNAGYAVSKVLVDGKNVGAATSYTFTNVRASHTLAVEFSKADTSNPFVDVPAGAYYYDAVLWAVQNGITTGVDATHFNPSGICTRAQAVTFLWRAAGKPAPKSTAMPFDDVPKGSYYESAVLWAVENGITNGTGAKTFSPNANCSRSQIVTFLWRSRNKPASGSSNPFTDVPANAFYTQAVLWAVDKGVTKGTGANTFSPNADCSRGQIVTFIHRAAVQ